MHRTRRPLSSVATGVLLTVVSAIRGESDASLGHDGFQAFHRVFIGRAANISRTVIVVVGKQATDFAILGNASSPVALKARKLMVALCPNESVLLPPQAVIFSNLVLVERLMILLNLLQLSLQLPDLLL